MTAIVRAWAGEMANEMPAANNSDPEDLPSAWPPEWGTAGEQCEPAPYAGVLLDQQPDQWAAKDQRQVKLAPMVTAEFTSNLFHAVGSDAEQGFIRFEKYHELAVWRVPLPDNVDEEEFDTVYKRVPVETHRFRRGYLPLAVVMQLGALTEFVVRLPLAAVCCSTWLQQAMPHACN